MSRGKLKKNEGREMKQVGKPFEINGVVMRCMMLSAKELKQLEKMKNSTLKIPPE
jgi:hypothetical protein